MNLRAALLLSLVGFLAWASVLGAPAGAADYNRGVEVNWQAMPSAVRYDVEWYSGADCGTKAGEEAAPGATWAKRLPAGNYCVRVRAVDGTARAGQWTDFFRLDVKPKPPFEVRQAGNHFAWDEVPYAKGYAVELVDAAGRTVATADPAKADYVVPDKILKNPRYQREGLSLRVRTKADGVPPSSPQSLEFHGEGVASSLTSGGGGGPGGPGAPSGPVQNGPPPEPVAAAEAVERYTMTGEKPLPPSREEWARARTPEQKEALRTRTLAGSRVELLERVDRRAPPDLKLGLGLSLGPYRYAGNVPASPESSSGGNSGFSPALRVDASYNSERPWGAFLHADQQAVRAHEASSSFTTFALGLEYHGDLDSLRESVLSLGFGLEYSKVPFPVAIPEDGSTVMSEIGLLGLRGRLEHRLRLTDRWSWSSGLTFRYAPSQTVVQKISESVNLTAGELALGPVYRLSRELEVGGAFSVRGVKVQDVQANALTFVSTELLFKAAYRVGPTEERRPAAEASFQAERARLWELQLHSFLGVRSQASSVGKVGDAKPIATPSAASPGVAADLSRKLTADGPLWLGAGFEHEGFQSGGFSLKDERLGFQAGLEHELLRRQDARIRYFAGWEHGSVEAPAEKQVLEVRYDAVAAGAAVEKSWSSRLSSELSARFGLPVSGKIAVADIGVVDAPATGFNAEWRVGVSVGYRLSDAFALQGGYTYRQERFGYTINQNGQLLGAMLQSTEGQFGLGLGVRW